MPTRIFSRDQLRALGVPPDDPDHIEHDPDILFDEQTTVLKYTALRRCVFRALDDGKTYAVEYETELEVGDYEIAGGVPDNNGWHTDDVEAVEVEECAVTVTQWLPGA
jgi:hypothetical protein